MNIMLLTNNQRKIHGLPLWRKRNGKKRYYTRCEASEAIDAFIDYCNCKYGTCPIANRDEYIKRCIPVINRCDKCFYYVGCDDCDLNGTDYCLVTKLNKDLVVENESI